MVNLLTINHHNQLRSVRYDELHPSEQADRVVAREVTKAILRVSDRWVDWLS